MVTTSTYLTMLFLPLLFALLLPPIKTTLALPSPPSLPPPLQTRSNPHKILPLIFTSSPFLIPIAVAASALEDLYWELQFNAMFRWRDLAPMSQFVVRHGTLEIGFFGAGADIEWEFVAEFAARMLIATRAGYASAYRTTWANEARTRAVSIGLRVRQ